MWTHVLRESIGMIRKIRNLRHTKILIKYVSKRPDKQTTLSLKTLSKEKSYFDWTILFLQLKQISYNNLQ